MKLTCANHYLKDTLILNEKTAGKNLTLPILSSVLLSAKNNKLTVTSTNLETGLEITIPAKIKKEGKVSISAKALNNLVSSFLDENITLEAQKENLVVGTKNTSSIIKGYSVSDFPLLPSIQKKNTFSLPAADFVSGLKSVWHAVSVSDIKPEISSVFISSQKNQPLVFAATDSFRLAEKTFFGNTSSFPGLLIPQRSVGEIIRIFDNSASDINFFIDKNQMVILCDNIKFFSRLTEGSFPDYKQIIPKNFSTQVSIEKDLFNNALRAASIFSGRLNELKMRVHPGEKLFEMEASSSDLGEHATHLPVGIKGEPLEVSFNHKYLLDGLQFINSKEIILGFNGPEKPLTIKGSEDSSYYYLVMPMKNI